MRHLSAVLDLVACDRRRPSAENCAWRPTAATIIWQRSQGLPNGVFSPCAVRYFRFKVTVSKAGVSSTKKNHIGKELYRASKLMPRFPIQRSMNHINSTNQRNLKSQSKSLNLNLGLINLRTLLNLHRRLKPSNLTLAKPQASQLTIPTATLNRQTNRLPKANE
jgi:hypothetical protein